jgi:hypothetical protein
VLASNSAWAQHKRRDRDVLIDNKKKLLTIYENPATPASPATVPPPYPDRDVATLRSAQTIIIRPNQWMQVGIDRQNPLIFVYTWKGIVLTPTADYTAAATFAASLKVLTAAAPFAAFEKSSQRMVGLPTTTDADKKTITARLSKVREISKTVGFDDGTVKEITALRNAVTRQVSNIPTLRKMTLDDASIGAAQDTVVGWNVAEQSKETNRLLSLLSNARNALLKELENDPDLFASDPGFVGTINMLSSEEANIRKLLAAAMQFAESMALVNTRLPLGDAVPFNAANNATATVEISYAAGAQDIVNDAFPNAALRPMTGTFEIKFEPYSSWALGGGPSVLYVFRKNDQDKNIGWRPVGMLTITKRSWLDGLMAPHIEVGVTPETDKIGLYFGVGLRVQGVFHLSGGVTAQQFKRSADSSDWLASGYLGVTVDLVPKK